MKLADYQLQRKVLEENSPRRRLLCPQCVQPEFSCYCSHIQKFDPQVQFVILIHPIEVRRRIATGRMSHLCLENSILVSGQDFSDNPVVNAVLNDPENQPMILYPGKLSKNLSEMTAEQRASTFTPLKKPVIFVIDGTWATAKKTIRQSRNLQNIPRICFSPDKPSRFRVRKQPLPGYYSTIEAIHQTLELLGTGSDRKHDNLLHVFDRMVERQLSFIDRAHKNPELCTYRRDRNRLAAFNTLGYALPYDLETKTDLRSSAK